MKYCILAEKLIMPYDIDAFNQLIRSRRSVFPAQFIPGKKIDDAIITQILENATWAPNHGHTEPWHFVVFTGDGLKRFARFSGDLFKVQSVQAGANFNEAKYHKLTTQPLLASHIIAICMKHDPARRIPEVEDIEAVACAVQNIYLSVTAYGLGGYWTTGGITYNENAKPFFGLEEHDRLLGFFYVGHVAVPSPEGKRRPLEEKVEWVRA
jgi:nitroreductase